MAGWTLWRWPTILPGLTVHEAAAPHDTLVCLVVAVLGGAIIVFPALGLLFRLTLIGRFRVSETAEELVRPPSETGDTRKAGRLGVASLIAGIGLLNIAHSGWAHGVGVTCLIAFVAFAFFAIVVSALDVRSANA